MQFMLPFCLDCVVKPPCVVIKNIFVFYLLLIENYFVSLHQTSFKAGHVLVGLLQIE